MTYPQIYSSFTCVKYFMGVKYRSKEIDSTSTIKYTSNEVTDT